MSRCEASRQRQREFIPGPTPHMQGLYIYKLRVPNPNAGRISVAAGSAERCSSNLHQLPGPLRFPIFIPTIFSVHCPIYISPIIPPQSFSLLNLIQNYRINDSAPYLRMTFHLRPVMRSVMQPYRGRSHVNRL
ncbi:uncharacterized protein K441DRAFT_331602 [Cenococcum geophilum 1.58]|uniref:Uncharacterized protein n=1 Tax=Cenococcum geophilum 1.58 TaxID=794803 RepID=A0ACC8ENY6_9PEZI|nr:hypothetical protein K441DRAFT_331602 [Cenococcum geophilum 1.58]